jgi:hypothetical protein
MVAIAAVVAMILCLPALGVGLLMDDYAHRMIMLRVAGTPVGPLEVFANFTGEPEITRLYLDQGILPWWTVPDYRLAFSRVLSAISMWIDYRWWPDSPVLMHLHSLLWLGAMVGAAGVLYRRLLGRGSVAGLAVLLFAIDDAHAMAASWLANRNALIATTLGLLSLIAHHRWRRGAWKWGWIASALCLALALLAGEAAVGAGAYFAAWAFTLEDGPWRRRLGSMVPSGTVFVCWATFYRLANLGSHGSGLYLDPGDGPLTFAAAIFQRAPILLLGQWSPVPAETATLVTSEQARLLYLVAWVVLAVLAVAFTSLVRGDRTSRFFAVGMFLALLPATGTFPANRLLTFVGFGAMGLVATFLTAPLGRPRRFFERGMAGFLVLTHLVIAPLFTPVTAYAMKIYDEPMEAAAATLPTAPEIAEQDLIVVSTPDYLTYLSFLPPIQHAQGKPIPRRMIGLLAGEVGAEVSRPDARTLRVELHGGLFDGYLGRLFRGERDRLRDGDVVDLEPMRVEVIATDDNGQPSELQFRFPVPLEDPSLRWITWEGRGYVPFTPPAVDEAISVPSPPSATGLSMPG